MAGPDPHAWLQQRVRPRAAEYAFWAAALVVPYALFPTYLSLANQIAIAALFALSLDLILGYAGIISLGHAAFFGLGAYTAGLLSRHGWGEPVTGLLAAGAVAGVVGYLVAFVIVRVRHLALLMITLGFGFLLAELANANGWLTGGADGLQGIDTWKLLGAFPFDLWGRTAYGYSFGVAFLLFLLCRRLVHSPFGLSLEGIRENPVRTAAVGAPNRRRLRHVFTFAAVVAGIAGGLLAQTTETVSLEVLGFQRSADVVVMLILGGTGRLYGAVVGSVIFLFARDRLAGMNPQYWYFWIGLLLMAVVLFLPGGLMGGLSRLVPARWRRP
ncbi:MAG: branched-chain amino acid ABC transporter permease [Deferrisomatales bacterium]